MTSYWLTTLHSVWFKPVQWESAVSTTTLWPMKEKSYSWELKLRQYLAGIVETLIHFLLHSPHACIRVGEVAYSPGFSYSHFTTKLGFKSL